MNNFEKKLNLFLKFVNHNNLLILFSLLKKINDDVNVYIIRDSQNIINIIPPIKLLNYS